MHFKHVFWSFFFFLKELFTFKHRQCFGKVQHTLVGCGNPYLWNLDAACSFMLDCELSSSSPSVSVSSESSCHIKKNVWAQKFIKGCRNQQCVCFQIGGPKYWNSFVSYWDSSFVFTCKLDKTVSHLLLGVGSWQLLVLSFRSGPSILATRPWFSTPVKKTI